MKPRAFCSARALGAVLVLLFAEFAGAQITIIANTNWSAISSGSGPAGQPSGTDAIIVKNGATLTVDVSNGQCASLALGQDGADAGAGTLWFNAGSLVECSGNVIVGTTAPNHAGTVTMTAGGTLTISGALLLTAGQSTFAAGSGTVAFNGSAAQTIAATTYHHLTYSGTATATLAGPTVVTGDLTIASGTLASGNQALTVAGHWINHGTFTPGTATVTFNGTGTVNVTGSSTTAFNNVTVNLGSSASVLDVLAPITLANNGLTLTQGTFQLSSASTITPFSGSETIPAGAGFHLNHASAVSNWGSSGSLTLNGRLIVDNGSMNIGSGSGNQLTVSGASSEVTLNGGTLTLAGRISVTSSGAGNGLTVSGGEMVVTTVGNNSASAPNFNLGATGKFTMTGGLITCERANSNASGAELVIASGSGAKSITGGTFRIGNASTPAAQTIEINSAVPIFHFTVNSANATAQLVNTPLTVNGDLLISAGTLDANNLNLELAGNWTNNGTFVPGTGTVTMNGTSPQNMSGSTFYNLTINNASGITLLTDETVGNTLSLLNGNVSTGANRMIITAGGTVARTSGHIVGNLQKHFAAGSNVVQTFEVGTGSDYTPVEVTIAQVNNSGNVTAKSTSGDHASIGTSALDATRSVNRNWTLTSDGTLTLTNYDATFNFVTGDLEGGANPSNLIVGKLDAGTWTYPAVGTRTATSTQATGMTSFSDFQLAEPASAQMTYTVTNTNDAGAGSLRQAIIDANAHANLDAFTSDQIHFNIPGAGPHTIAPTSALPTITDPVIIDGLTQPGASCASWPPTLKIELSGTNAGAGANGLTMTAGSSTVRGLVINRFSGDGIEMQSNGGNTVECNLIGTDVAGASDLGNGAAGVSIDGAANNIIGGNAVSARNLISGNATFGVDIVNSGASGNTVLGNYVGTDATGAAALGNSASGIDIRNSASANTIGGTTAGAGNVIAGNGGVGLNLANAGLDHVVQGNSIGVNANGAALGNAGGGINIFNTSGATIGGVTAGARNVISGNSNNGIEIGGASTNTMVQGNYLGTDPSGTLDVGNNLSGVYVNGASNTFIGGAAAGAGNVISGNNSQGVRLANNASGNVVQGNFIGTNAAGTAAVANGPNGVEISSGASNNTVGGTAAGARNVISGNAVHGVFIIGSTTTGNLVQGNYIGTDVTGMLDLGNMLEGVSVAGAANNNTVGGTVAGARNLISGNNGNGVALISGASGNLVQGNLIGTEASGTTALPNTLDGISIQSASNNTIGGTTAAARNIISGNGEDGVGISGAGATGNLVQGNYIGTDLNGTSAVSSTVANSQSGVFISAAGNTIGGTAPGAGNLISGNRARGVLLFTGSMSNLVQGNLIGTDVSGSAGLSNGSNGIEIQDGTSNTIGGAGAGAGNTIAFNAEDGIEVVSGTGNAVQRNSIFSNTDLGLEIDNDGVTANDAGDGDTGANNLQNFPVLNCAHPSASSTEVKGSLNSTANTTFTLEFFSNTAADPSGFGEGETFQLSATVTTDATGNANFTVNLPTALALGQFVSATATDPGNNTSEFSRSIAVTNELLADAGADAEICANGSATLGGSPAATGGATPYTYSWSPATGLNDASLANPTASPAATTAYTLTVTDANGCTATDEMTVTVSALPTVTFNPAGPYCVNAAAVDLTAFVSPSGGTFSGNGVTSAGLFTPSDAGVGTHTITYTFTSGGNCTNSASQNIVVNPLPSVTFNAVSAVCVNAAALDLTSYVSPSGGTFFGNGVTSAGIFTPGNAGAGTHTITYSFTDGNNCTNTASQNIVVNPLPAVTFDPVGPYCVNSPAVDLTSFISPAGGTFSGNGVTSSGLFTPSDAGVGTHQITYSFTDGNNCTNSASQNITVETLPTVTFNPAGPYCVNAAAVDLTAFVSPSGGTFSGNGVTSAGLFTPSDAGTGTHTITYTFTSGGNCTNSASQNIVVNPLPSVTFNAVSAVCVNAAALDLTSYVSPSGGTFSGNGVTSAGVFTPGNAGAGTHTITYSFTDGNNCTNTASQNIVVNPLPAVTFDPVGPYCVNAAVVDLTAFVSPSGGSFSGNGVTSAGLFTPSDAGTGTHTITYTFTSGGNCTNSASQNIVVNPLPSVTFNPAGPYCVNAAALDLTSYISPSGGTFSGNGVTSAGLFTPSDAGVGTHTITYSFTDGNSCTNTASQNIVVNPLPAVTFDPVGPFLVTDAPVDLSSAVSPAGGSFAGPGISGTMFDPSVAGVGTHTVTYTFTDGNSCTNSASQNIAVNPVMPPSDDAFVLLANKITLQQTKQATPSGRIHSNGTLTIEKGSPSTYNSNLTAIGKITIYKNNLINGNVTSPLPVANAGVINGTLTLGPVDFEALPSLSYSAGGPSHFVPSNGTLTLLPGSYHHVVLNSFSTLKLSSGDYFFTSLRYNGSTTTTAVLEIDLSSGEPITLNVVSNLYLGHEAAMRLLPNGEGDSELVTINTRQSSLTLGREAYLIGTFNAPQAKAVLEKNSQLRGALRANEILVARDCLFLHHDSPGSLPGPGNLPKPSLEEEEVSSDQFAVTSYQLEQNYPNPFNPSTVISFQLPAAGEVSLLIFNTNGQLVKQVARGNFASGKHTLVWDATDERGARVASGVYVYVIKAGEFTAQKKLVVLK